MTNSKQIVYGTFNLIESVALRPILYWVPFYFVFKSVFIVWRESGVLPWGVFAAI